MIDHGEPTQPKQPDWETMLSDLDVSSIETDLTDEAAFAAYILQTQQEADAAFAEYSNALMAANEITRELIAKQTEIENLGNVGDLPKFEAEMDAKREELARRLQRKDELFQKYLDLGKRVTNAINRSEPQDDVGSEP